MWVCSGSDWNSSSDHRLADSSLSAIHRWRIHDQLDQSTPLEAEIDGDLARLEDQKMRRRKEAIWSDILKAAETSAIKTQIVYKANLNFRTVEHYLRWIYRSKTEWCSLQGSAKWLCPWTGRSHDYETWSREICFIDKEFLL
jgi:hypothetical protein